MIITYCIYLQYTFIFSNKLLFLNSLFSFFFLLHQVWSCGTQDCSRTIRQGQITFGSGRPGDWQGTSWPLSLGIYRMVMVNYIEGNDDFTFYKAVALSSTFDVENACQGGSNGNPFGGRGRPTLRPTQRPQQAPQQAPQPTQALQPGMKAVVAEARRDLRDLVLQQNIVGANWLRMSLHDCVGGRCDGCINVNNPESGGFATGMNALTGLEAKYTPRGLSRADLWVLASYVGVEMAMPGADPVTNPFIPFTKFGRQTCNASMTRYGR